MSGNDWGDLRVGRTIYRETWDAIEGTDGMARTLDLKGQEGSPPNPRDTVVCQHDNLTALEAGAVLPVTFTDKPEQDCYAMVARASSTLSDWNGEDGVVTATWTASLSRCGTGNEIDLQSRLTGAARQNDFSEDGTGFHAPPIGHYAYFTGPNTPGIVTRTGEDGAVKVYTGTPAGVMPKWGCAPTDYPGGRVRALDTAPAAGPLELEGTDRRAPAASWQLSNGLLRVSPGAAAGTLLVGTWSGGAWHTDAWDVSVAGVALSAFDSATVVHNAFEHVIVRLTSSRTPGRVSLDLGLRRGSRLLELYVQTGTAATLAVALRTPQTGAQTSGYVAATGDDANGNRYVVGSARTFTASTSGGLSKAAVIALDAFVAYAVGGAAAVSGDTAADLYAQYVGVLPEAVYAVRR